MLCFTHLKVCLDLICKEQKLQKAKIKIEITLLMLFGDSSSNPNGLAKCFMLSPIKFLAWLATIHTELTFRTAVACWFSTPTQCLKTYTFSLIQILSKIQILKFSIQVLLKNLFRRKCKNFTIRENL